MRILLRSAASLALLLIMALAAPASAALVPSQTTYYMSNTGSACGADANYQLLTSPRSGGPNCGYIGGAPFGELFTQSGLADANNVYSSNAEFTLDGSRDADGQITIRHANGATGVGQIVVDVTLRAGLVNSSSSKTLASTSFDYVIAGDLGTSTIPFTLDLDDSLGGTEFDSLNLDVTVRGLHASSGYTSSQGDSFFELPILIDDEA